MNEASVEAVYAEYDREIHENLSPSWNTVQLVAEDRDGEAVWEVWDVAQRMYGELTDRDRDLLSDALPAYQARLAAELTR